MPIQWVYFYLQKHYSSLNKISEVSGISLENDKDSIFLQNFYGLFFKSINLISRSKKDEILKDDELLKETTLYFYNLDRSQDLSREDLKDVISIYKLKIEDGEDVAEKLIEKYTKSYLFKQNLKDIVSIYRTAIEFGKSFEFINENIVSLLAVWITKKTKKDFIDYIDSDLNIKTFLFDLKGDRSIDLELWAYGKIISNNLNDNLKLKSLKDYISNDFTKLLKNKFLKLGTPAKKDKDKFEIFISKIDGEKERIHKELKASLEI